MTGCKFATMFTIELQPKRKRLAGYTVIARASMGINSLIYNVSCMYVITVFQIK